MDPKYKRILIAVGTIIVGWCLNAFVVWSAYSLLQMIQNHDLRLIISVFVWLWISYNLLDSVRKTIVLILRETRYFLDPNQITKDRVVDNLDKLSKCI